MASYASYTCNCTGSRNDPKTFIHTFGDSHFYASIGKRTQWHKENFNEVQKRIRNVSAREEYMEVVEWINKNAPPTAMRRSMIM
ncbi:MAG: hypothetical protein IPJ37_17865 [Bacteroidales bacterium]|nr:hypothetical protein [Bacteroidales bacterium]